MATVIYKEESLDNFIDVATYCFNKDGLLTRIIWPEHMKEDEIMGRINWEKLKPEIIKLRAAGKTIKDISNITGIAKTPIQEKLADWKAEIEEAIKQAEAQKVVMDATPDATIEQEESQPVEEIMTEENEEVKQDEPIPFEPLEPIELKLAYCKGLKRYVPVEAKEVPSWEELHTEGLVQRAKSNVLAVLNDPISLALMKELIKQEVI